MKTLCIFLGVWAALGLGTVARCAPIHDAAAKGDLNKVVAILKKHPDEVNSRDKFGNEPLHLAVRHNKVAIAELLLANGADVNAGQNGGPGETPLTLALQSYQHREMLELLLTHGAEVNVLSNGNTPLHTAVDRNLIEDVELLLANGADPNAKGMNWQTPVHFAVLSGHIPILKMLLDYGADPNAKDSEGNTPMHYARHEAAEVLIKYGGHK